MTGKDLKMLRLLHNVKTQKKVAELLGVTERTIALYEAQPEKTLSQRVNTALRIVFNVELYEQIKGKFANFGGR